tara:strand:- start:9210 stop:9938 length:729 start_codon:yes stop_codon:yes gene_type:complete
MRFKANKYTKEEFARAVSNNFSIRSVLLELGLYGSGANYTTFHRNVQVLNLDTSHFLGQGHLKGKTHNWGVRIPLEEILIENSSYSNTNNVKKRLLRKGLLVYECSVCKISTWIGKTLSLQLDHINGINNDHRIENLRLLCPNCHSQTPTFAGRNKQKGVPRTKQPTKQNSKPPNTCVDCNKNISRYATRCKPCQGTKGNPTKIDWPDTSILRQMVEASNYTKVGKELGVSDNAIRKRLRNW